MLCGEVAGEERSHADGEIAGELVQAHGEAT